MDDIQSGHTKDKDPNHVHRHSGKHPDIRDVDVQYYVALSCAPLHYL